MTWTNIANGNIDVGSPVRSVDIIALRDNISAVANGDSGAPKVKNAAINAGAVTADKLSGNQTGSAPVFGARAWVKFDGTRNSSGAPDSSNTNRLIIGSGNVSSVLKLSTGQYQVNITNPLPNSNYCAVGTAIHNEDQYAAANLGIGNFTTSSFIITTHRSDIDTPFFVNSALVNAIVMG